MSAEEGFLWSVKNGELDKVKAYVEGKKVKRSKFPCQCILPLPPKGKFDVNAQISAGRSPIHFAADYGHVDLIEYLVKQGANVNVS